MPADSGRRAANSALLGGAFFLGKAMRALRGGRAAAGGAAGREGGDAVALLLDAGLLGLAAVFFLVAGAALVGRVR